MVGLCLPSEAKGHQCALVEAVGPQLRESLWPSKESNHLRLFWSAKILAPGGRYFATSAWLVRGAVSVTLAGYFWPAKGAALPLACRAPFPALLLTDSRRPANTFFNDTCSTSSASISADTFCVSFMSSLDINSAASGDNMKSKYACLACRRCARKANMSSSELP